MARKNAGNPTRNTCAASRLSFKLDHYPSVSSYGASALLVPARLGASQWLGVSIGTLGQPPLDPGFVAARSRIVGAKLSAPARRLAGSLLPHRSHASQRINSRHPLRLPLKGERRKGARYRSVAHPPLLPSLRSGFPRLGWEASVEKEKRKS